MEQFHNKKLNPYLYPFKMKISDKNLLHMKNLNVYKEIDIDTVFLIPTMQVLNRSNHDKIGTNKNIPSEAIFSNSVTPNMMFLPSNNPTVSLEILKIMGETTEWPEHISIALKKPKTRGTGLKRPTIDIALVSSKSAHFIVEESKTLTNIPSLRSKCKQIAFERSESPNTSSEMPKRPTLDIPLVSSKSAHFLIEEPEMLTNVRPKCKPIAFEGSDSLNTISEPKPQDICLEKPESQGKIEAKTECVDFTSKSQSQESANQRPVSPDIPQGREPSDEDGERPVPELVSWTRMDQAQLRLDTIPIRVKVAMGVFSGIIATTVVHPLDVIKVRLQLFPKKVTTTHMLRRIMACEGAGGLYAGLTAGVLRQLTYTGARLAVYNSLYEQYKKSQGKYPDFRARLRIAIVAGLAGAFMGVPSEVALVRMIEVRRLRRSRCSPPCSPSCKYVQRPEGAIKQLLRVARREGVATWWRGAVPTLVRSVFVTTAQVGVYSRVRAAFTRGEFVDTGLYLHMCTAGVSSIFSAVLSLPVDQVKTRYQSYTERDRKAMDIFKGMLKAKGVRYLWKGLVPYYVRQAVHTMITYVVLDQLVALYPSSQDKDKP